MTQHVFLILPLKKKDDVRLSILLGIRQRLHRSALMSIVLLSIALALPLNLVVHVFFDHGHKLAVAIPDTTFVAGAVCSLLVKVFALDTITSARG
jgi:hypothetical protein